MFRLRLKWLMREQQEVVVAGVLEAVRAGSFSVSLFVHLTSLRSVWFVLNMRAARGGVFALQRGRRNI